MAKHIITMVQPFMIDQQVIVYENGNKIDAIQCTVDDLPTTIADKANQYEITDIQIGGPRKYNKILGNKIAEEYLSKYSTKGKEIEIKFI